MLTEARAQVDADGASSTPLSCARGSADAMSVSPRMAGKRRQAHAGRRARRAAREGAELLDLLNHELRTPLTTVLGYTEVVRAGEAGAVSGEQEHLLGRVEAGAHALQALVEALMRVTADEMAAGGTPQVADVVRRVLDEREAQEPVQEPVRATA